MSDPTSSTGLDAIREAAKQVVERFASAGHRLYLVGGIVRDHRLGRLGDTNDLDATTDARPDRIKAVVAGLADAVWTQGERFGTIGCVIDGRTWEITTHRAEAYDESSRKPTVTFGDRIEDDLARRDFTVNAMAIDLADGSVVDPHGGAADLAAGVLRTPLDPEVSFSEDPLRMLRAARFHAAYGLAPVPELVDAITSMLDRMEIVSAERIRDELQKLIVLDDPTDGLRLLVDTALMATVLPCFTGDVVRVGRRLATVPDDPAMRWAALLLDGGVEPGDLRALVFSGRLMADTLWFASSPLLGEAAAEPGEAEVRRAAASAPGDRRLEAHLDFAAAVRAAEGLDTAPIDGWRAVLASLRASEADLDDPAPLLGGHEIAALLDLEPGPDIGVAQRWLRDLRFDEGPVAADVAADRLRDWWSSRG